MAAFPSESVGTGKHFHCMPVYRIHKMRLTSRSRGLDELHDFSLGEESNYALRPYGAMMPGQLQQEVHHGYCRPADLSRGPSTVSPGRLATLGRRHSDRPAS